MSTRAIDALIEDIVAGEWPTPGELAVARKELRAIREAAKTVGDCCAVREPYRRSDAVNAALDLMQRVGKES